MPRLNMTARGSAIASSVEPLQPMPAERSAFCSQSSNWAVFLVPGLALWLPSGYGIGIFCLLLFAIFCWRSWWSRPRSSSDHALTCLIAVIALSWTVQTGPHPGISAFSLETGIKHLLAIPCLYFLLACAPRPRFLWAGLACGGIGSGLLALIQRYGLHADRASGFTNAIQYGNLSLYLGLAALIVLTVSATQLSRNARLALAVACILSICASVLSQTRGGWLALLLVIPVCLWIMASHGLRRESLLLGSCLLALALAAWGLKHAELSQRLQLVQTEVQAYTQRHDSASSIGQRLEHWRLAWNMGLQRPWLGWGRSYKTEKARQVEQGQIDAFVQYFDHAHNDFLDSFARRGLVGLTILMIYLLLPVFYFWPTRKRLDRGPPQARQTRLSLRLLGLTLSLLYIGFGFTQVFFAHNSGRMFYLYMLIIIYATLQGVSITGSAVQPEPPE